jgi:hypothetical protein
MGSDNIANHLRNFSMYYFNVLNKQNISLYCTKIISSFWLLKFMNPNDTQVNQTQHVTYLYSLGQVQMRYYTQKTTALLLLKIICHYKN